MVLIVFMLVSFALIGVMMAAAFVTVRRETERSSEAKRRAPELQSAFAFFALEPRIDPVASRAFKETLSRILVSDYLQSSSIRQVVDEALPLRGSRRDRPFSPERPLG
jgi:type II secretory pathway component PulJ